MNFQDIIFDNKNGLITIKGVFIEEDPQENFRKLDAQIDDFLSHSPQNITLDFKIEYFNTNMSMVIRDLLRHLSENLNGKNLKVNWYYETEDEDLEDAGNEFKLIFNELNFEIIEVSEL